MVAGIGAVSAKDGNFDALPNVSTEVNVFYVPIGPIHSVSYCVTIRYVWAVGTEVKVSAGDGRKAAIGACVDIDSETGRATTFMYPIPAACIGNLKQGIGKSYRNNG